MTEFPAAYERVLQRPFDPVDYGLCELTDLLNEVSENVVVIKNTLDEIFIAIPKREQTADEMMKTRQFAVEVNKCKYHSSYISSYYIWYVGRLWICCVMLRNMVCYLTNSYQRTIIITATSAEYPIMDLLN